MTTMVREETETHTNGCRIGEGSSQQGRDQATEEEECAEGGDVSSSPGGEDPSYKLHCLFSLVIMVALLNHVAIMSNKSSKLQLPHETSEIMKSRQKSHIEASVRNTTSQAMCFISIRYTVINNYCC